MSIPKAIGWLLCGYLLSLGSSSQKADTRSRLRDGSLAQNSHSMTHFTHYLALAWLTCILLAIPSYAQVINRSLCEQCITTSKAELQRCLEAAISQEDKRFCRVKQDTHVKNCENECRIEREAETALMRESAIINQILKEK